jgi:amino acid transporter
MASSGIDYHGQQPINEKNMDMEKSPSFEISNRRASIAKPVYDSTHRKLKARHIQLIGIG